MRYLLSLLLFCSVAAHGQQNMQTILYRFWNNVRVGSGIGDNGTNDPAVALYVGRSAGNQGVYLVPQDTLTITSPPQGLLISLSTDLGRLWQFNGTHWERCGGGTGGGGGPFETPLTFSNGLTRTANAAKLGGPLQLNTNVDASGFRLTITNVKLGINNLAPNYDLDVSGTARINTLPYVVARDTMLTYDPVTRQVSYTVRPACADSASTMNVVVGTDVPVGNNTFQSNTLIGKTIRVFREGDLQSPDLVSFNASSGTVSFSPVLNYRERLQILYLCQTNFTVVIPNLTSESSINLTTESGVPLVYF